jgi:ArsR family transcriptional regulator
MRTIAGRFRAAADETRLKILALLDHHGELCVCDVERALRISQSKASRHLRYLVSRGFLDDRPAGVWVHYRIRQQLDPASAAVLAAVRIAFPQEFRAELDERLETWRASQERPVETPPPLSAGVARAE